jgi:hypothetical protein
MDNEKDMQPSPVKNINFNEESVDIEYTVHQRILDIEKQLQQLDNEYEQDLLPKQRALQNAIQYLQQQEYEMIQHQQQQHQKEQEQNRNELHQKLQDITVLHRPPSGSTTTTTILTDQHSTTMSQPPGVDSRLNRNATSVQLPSLTPVTTTTTSNVKKRKLLPKQHQQEVAAARLAQALFQLDSTTDEEEEEEEDDNDANSSNHSYHDSI